MRHSLGEGKDWTQKNVRLLVDVYDAWGKPTEAARYRKLLTAGSSPEIGGSRCGS